MQCSFRPTSMCIADRCCCRMYAAFDFNFDTSSMQACLSSGLFRPHPSKMTWEQIHYYSQVFLYVYTCIWYISHTAQGFKNNFTGCSLKNGCMLKVFMQTCGYINHMQILIARSKTEICRMNAAQHCCAALRVG